MKDNSLIIIPTYNEAENIKAVINKIFSLDDYHSILVVDDNSPDRTSNIVRNLKKNYEDKLFLITREKKDGLGSAYKEGFKWAIEKNFSYIFEMDADLSHDPNEIKKLKRMLVSGECDVAIGSRYLEGVSVVNWPLSRIFLSYFANIYVRLITCMPVKDSTSGFVGYKIEALSSLDIDKIKFNGYAFQIEMKFTSWKYGFNIVEVPVIFTDRSEGTSKMSGGIFFEAVLGVIQMKIKSLFRSWKKI